MKETIKITDKNYKDFFSEKTQKNYTKCSIKDENGRWISGFKSDATDMWNVGDEIEIEITENNYNGKTYYNFKSPTKTDLLESRVIHIENILKRLIAEIKEIKNSIDDKKEAREAVEELDDMPDPFEDIE